MLQLHIEDESGILTVSKLNQQVKALLEERFPFVWVKGEISNFRVPASDIFISRSRMRRARSTRSFFERKTASCGLSPNRECRSFARPV